MTDPTCSGCLRPLTAPGGCAQCADFKASAMKLVNATTSFKQAVRGQFGIADPPRGDLPGEPPADGWKKADPGLRFP